MSDLLVLCYHAVSASWPAALSVTPAALDRQLGFLARRGYVGARFSDAVAQPPRQRTVVVTFDDNYRSVLELAKPILDRYGYPGTLYVPTDWVGDPRPMRWDGVDCWLGTEHEHELMALGWDELRSLQAAGWEIGSHTCSHPHLPAVDDAALRHELDASKARLEEELDQPCRSLAYPYGDMDQRVQDAARVAGYEAACTIPRLVYPPEPLKWPRTPIFHVDSAWRYRMKVSRGVRALRRQPQLVRLSQRIGWP